MVDPHQSAEMDRLDKEVLAAAAAVAAISIVREDVEAWALEAALERLGAMASLRIVSRVGKGKCGRKKEFGGERVSESFWALSLTIYKGENPRGLWPYPTVSCG